MEKKKEDVTTKKKTNKVGLIKRVVAAIVNKSRLPYTRIMEVENTYYSSAILPDLADDHMLLSPGQIQKQAREVFAKVDIYLEKAGLNRGHIFYVTIILGGSQKHASTVWEIYDEFFQKIKIMPIRRTGSEPVLPFDAMLQLQFRASKKRKKAYF